MKQRISCALIALAASAALPLMAANPPPAPAPPPAAPPAPAPPVSLTFCYHSGEDLAACAESWGQMNENGNKVDGLKVAWEASGFEHFVAALRYENEDSSWCEPAGAATTYDDAFKTVAKYLKDNPDRVKSSSAAVLVDKALHEAYPCSKKTH
jgi:Ssp1 endopeptidase immunity protein Rap1a